MDLLREIYRRQSLWYSLYVTLIISITLLFCLLLAWPYVSQKTQKEIKNGVDISLVFDVSYSMIATDIFPSRIEVAKQVLGSFIGELTQDRVGLILFAGKAFQSVPLSYDYAFLQDFIAEMGVDTIEQSYGHLQGTAIGDALVMAAGTLTEQQDSREKVIVFITDGEANKGVDPKLALKLLKEKNIKTYTIGVGKSEQTSITVPGLWGFPQKVLVSGVDEELLQKIATETGGKYFKAESKSTFQEVLRKIALLEKKPLLREYEQFQVSLLRPLSLLVLFFLLGILGLLYFKHFRYSWE